MIRSLLALGLEGILIALAGLNVKPQFVIPKSKISLTLCTIAPKSFALPFGARFTPDSTAFFAFLASLFTQS